MPGCPLALLTERFADFPQVAFIGFQRSGQHPQIADADRALQQT
jgi:hypothetical protein